MGHINIDEYAKRHGMGRSSFLVEAGALARQDTAITPGYAQWPYHGPTMALAPLGMPPCCKMSKKTPQNPYTASANSYKNNSNLARLDGLRWQALAPGDLDALYALHLESIAGLDAAIVKPETRDFLDAILQGRGSVLGVWSGAALVAYGVLQHALLPDDNPRALLALPPDMPLLKLAGAAVAPAWRGLGLQQRLTAQRMAQVDQMRGGAALFATAAPANPASWRSLLASGLQVRALQYRYGGHARYLLAHIPGDAPAPSSVQTQDWGLDDLAEQQRLLGQGFRGIAPGRAPCSLRLAPYRQEFA